VRTKWVFGDVDKSAPVLKAYKWKARDRLFPKREAAAAAAAVPEVEVVVPVSDKCLAGMQIMLAGAIPAF
jgi:hypothetical protein